jgi:hypothetical protein
MKKKKNRTYLLEYRREEKAEREQRKESQSRPVRLSIGYPGRVLSDLFLTVTDHNDVGHGTSEQRPTAGADLRPHPGGRSSDENSVILVTSA